MKSFLQGGDFYVTIIREGMDCGWGVGPSNQKIEFIYIFLWYLLKFQYSAGARCAILLNSDEPTYYAKLGGSEILFTVSFIKPYRYPVHKCTGSRQGFMKWAISGA